MSAVPVTGLLAGMVTLPACRGSSRRSFTRPPCSRVWLSEMQAGMVFIPIR